MIIGPNKNKHLEEFAEELFARHLSSGEDASAVFVVASLIDQSPQAIDAVFAMAPAFVALGYNFALIIRGPDARVQTEHLGDFWEAQTGARTGLPVLIREDPGEPLDYVVSSIGGAWISTNPGGCNGEIVTDTSHIGSLIAHFQFESDIADPTTEPARERQLITAV